MSDGGDPYVHPGSSILRNRLGITDPEFLDKQERSLVILRSRGKVPRGAFDLAHLRAIHRHLFQDVYDWAGELRTVEISKGRQQFQFRKFIETGMVDVHGRLARSRFLKGLSAATFAEQTAIIIGDINDIHPSAKGTAVPSCSISSNSPLRPAITSTLPDRGGLGGSRLPSRATPPTTSPWRPSSPRP